MGVLDWIVLIFSIGFIVLYGIWRNIKNKDLQEYFKGSNKSRWWTIGISVMATQASAITFLSTPGQAYSDGMGFIQFYFGLPFAIIIISIFFLPIYHKLKLYTAYEFLEKRFNKKTRNLASLLFLIQRGLAAGITIYAPAIIMSLILKWPLHLLIIIIGSLVTFYTLIGGTKAVNVTQKQQMFVIFIGLFITIYYIFKGIPKEFSLNEVLEIAGANGKLDILNFDFDFKSRYTFWSGITGGLFLALSYFGTDQSQVQRYISGKNLRESQKGLFFNAILKVPMQFLILFIGVSVFVFYQFNLSPINFNTAALEKVRNSKFNTEFEILEQKHKEIQEEKFFLMKTFSKSKGIEEIKKLQESESLIRNDAKSLISKVSPSLEVNDKDYVFINFIVNNLPSGIIGLLISVILCAAMSSTASELNALAACSYLDIYRNNFKVKSNYSDLQMSKFMTLIWGLIAIIFALTATLAENLIQLVNIIGSIFYGTILGIFLVGFFFKKIQAKNIFNSALSTQIIIFIIFYLDVVGYLWLNFIGSFLTVLLAYILQKVAKE
ncbi:MAG: sodium:solute symporter [Flavobacteriales bacterium TMED96]|nr:MAG: sodium:solute symporter [Flavobacteriales bacterium TMED96]|tara:strand:+ start:5158 stop:6807 length:1650 start_codon:yes stop_codon:yes gene_type:complete